MAHRLRTLGPRLGLSQAFIGTITTELNKRNSKLMYLEARITLNSSWDLVAGRLGERGLDLLEEIYELFETVDKKTDMRVESTFLLGHDEFEAMAVELAWYAKRNLKEVCLLYLGENPKAAAKMSHKDIITKLGGQIRGQ
jgi:hypothetical protein